MNRIRIMDRVMPFFFLPIFLFVFSCSRGEDVQELVRIKKEITRLNRIEVRMRNGSLAMADLQGIPGTDLTPADPASIQYGINIRYLEEFTAFMEQLKSSSLKRPSSEHSSEYRRKYARQQKLRMDIYRQFMRKLSRLEGDQLDALFQLLATADPQVRAQIYLLLNDMSLAYYKNVEEINAPTMDDKLTFYSVKVDIGYDIGNKRMQTILNENRKVMSDIVRNYFSGLKAEDMTVDKEFLLKAGLLIRLNKKLLTYDKKGNLYGVQDVAILKLQTFEVP